MSAGFVARRILSTCSAARRNRCGKFVPYRNQCAVCDELANGTHRRQSRVRRKLNNLRPVNVGERVADHEERLLPPLERVQAGGMSASRLMSAW
jgi:hypothetical protein